MDKHKEKETPKVDKVAELETQVNHWKNEFYKAYADTKNLRDSLEKDHKEMIKYRSEGFLEKLLPVLDSFHMALSNVPDDEKLKNYLTGFQFIYKNLVSALESEGVTEISPSVGDEFSATTMEAVDTVESDEEENKIVRVYAKGYLLHDRIVRPAMVSVNKKKTLEKEENNIA